jgi:hypothetical protein
MAQEGPDSHGTILVNYEQMMALVGHGMHSSEPINGPNEGEPQYLVPATAMTYLECKLYFN